jgi:hypothetical protein
VHSEERAFQCSYTGCETKFKNKYKLRLEDSVILLQFRN